MQPGMLTPQARHTGDCFSGNATLNSKCIPCRARVTCHQQPVPSRDALHANSNSRRQHRHVPRVRAFSHENGIVTCKTEIQLPLKEAALREWDNPWQELGVPADSDEGTIKKAYRKLVLQCHPDHNHGDEGKFVVVQQAYESLIKNKGREVAPRNEDSWNFHDWHWKFRMQRAWTAKHEASVPEGGDPCASTARLMPEHRSRVQAQLSALKRRAAFREQKLEAAASAAAMGQGVESTSEAWWGLGSAFMGGAEAAASIRDSLQGRDGDKAGPGIVSPECGAFGGMSSGHESSEGQSSVGSSGSSGDGQATEVVEEVRTGHRHEVSDRPRFRTSPDQLRHQLAGLHRKAAFRNHIVD